MGKRSSHAEDDFDGFSDEPTANGRPVVFHVSSSKTSSESKTGKVKGAKGVSASTATSDAEGFMVEIKKGTEKGHVLTIKTDASASETAAAGKTPSIFQQIFNKIKTDASASETAAAGKTPSI